MSEDSSPTAQLLRQAEALLALCRSKSLTIATAESCTGGLLAALITEVAGASDVFDRGYVTYSNRAKSELLGVPAAVLAACGAVSGETARAMAEGALRAAGADIAAAITGIAGPGGGSAAKPVGLVHIACARRGPSTLHARHVFPGSRSDIRQAAVGAALELLWTQAAAVPPP